MFSLRGSALHKCRHPIANVYARVFLLSSFIPFSNWNLHPFLHGNKHDRLETFKIMCIMVSVRVPTFFFSKIWPLKFLSDTLSVRDSESSHSKFCDRSPYLLDTGWCMAIEVCCKKPRFGGFFTKKTKNLRSPNFSFF